MRYDNGPDKETCDAVEDNKDKDIITYRQHFKKHDCTWTTLHEFICCQ